MSEPPTTARPSASTWPRRALLFGGAATALVGGVWVSRGVGGRDAPGATVGAIWDWVLKTPEGRDLPLAAFRPSGLVLNFWATWCPPCLREFPELDRLEREIASRGWHVVAAAAEDAAAVQGFLARTPVGFAVGVGGHEALNRSRALGNAQGGLPFTAIFAPGGALKKTLLGETTRQAIMAVIDRSGA